MKNPKSKIVEKIAAFLILNFAFLIPGAIAQQEQPPAPAAPRSIKIPAVQTQKLPNGLEIAVAERKNVPLVTVSLLMRNSGAAGEEKDGLANTTAALLTKGTKTRTATQIAEDMEFLGGNITAGAGWTTTVVSVNVPSDKLDNAMAIMSDVVLNPTFAESELELFKTQTIDELNVALKQPSSLANFVASRYTFGEHVSVGTPESLQKITKADIENFYRSSYLPGSAVLIFAGDIAVNRAASLAGKFFGSWKNSSAKKATKITDLITNKSASAQAIVGKILVVDLPNSGQAAVTYAKRLSVGRTKINNGKSELAADFYPSTVANTVLGGGYSARLNQEIRIKRGLSYGAGSNLSWRSDASNFSTRTQTKNVSAAEVAELVSAEIGKLGSGIAEESELTPRKLTLTGSFGRDLETTNGLVGRLVDLYTYGLSADQLNSYMTSVQNITAQQVKNFAASNLSGGDLIIVGDAKIFMDDLKKRFPDKKIEVIPASDLDLNSSNLRKSQTSSVKPKS